MVMTLGDRRMKKSEIRELMRQKRWSTARLADELFLKEDAVIKWLSGRRNPSGPAVRLMQLWLSELRGEIRIIETNKMDRVPVPAEPVPA